MVYLQESNSSLIQYKCQKTTHNDLFTIKTYILFYIILNKIYISVYIKNLYLIVIGTYLQNTMDEFHYVTILAADNVTSALSSTRMQLD